MAKSTTQFICQNCGSGYAKWSGKCVNCEQWNSLVEQKLTPSLSLGRSAGMELEAQPISKIINDQNITRLRLVDADLNLVLGGGIVPGSSILLAGQPGIGKSTLLLQLSFQIAKHHKVLYVSGEESAGQVKLRAERLGVLDADRLDFSASVVANDISQTISTGQYALVIIDSIQTMMTPDISSSPGTVSQITNSANLIIQAAKRSGTAVILVGHVTKEGYIAGPKILEHLVDVVLQLEGDRYGGFKIARASKNRFGSTNEVAIMEMTDKGLIAVNNPSASLLSERQNLDGSVILATIEGNRPLLVEIQALVNATSFGYPKRTASGFDLNRLNLLVAILERRTKLKLADKDIFINVVGGLRLDDQASDLAVCMAIASATVGLKLDDRTVVFGEVGLGGEIRSVTASDRRVAEAKKLGFKQAIGPKYYTKNTFIKGVGDLRSALIKYLKND